MYKVKVVENFTLEKFDELKNIVRYNNFNNNEKENGKLYVGDVFECEETMAKYLLGDNKLKKAVVETIEMTVPIEVEVEAPITVSAEIPVTLEDKKTKPKTTKKKTIKKTSK